MRKKVCRLFLLPLFLTVVLASCEQENEPFLDLGYRYYQIKLGQTNTFAVDSIYFSALSNSSDTVRCFIKETIDVLQIDSFSKTYKVNTYLSYDTSKGWNWYDFYFYRTDTNSVQRIEGNTSRLIFVYPVIKNKKWNVNTYNSNIQEFAYYKQVGFQYNNYINCTEIILREEINFIEEKVLKEVYAENLGLVFRYFSNINITNSIKDGVTVTFRRI